MESSQSSVKLPLDLQIEKLEKVLEKNPQDLSTLMAYAEANLRRGRRLAALSAYQKVAKVKPETVEVHLALAKIYLLQKMYGEAYNELHEVFVRDPGNVEGNVLFREASQEAPLPEPLKEYFKAQEQKKLRKEDFDLYLKQLEMEKEKLDLDVEELSRLLDANPLDTILEYNKNMTAKRRQAVERLYRRAKELESRGEEAQEAELPSVKPSGPAEAVEVAVSKKKVPEAPVEAEGSPVTHQISGDAAFRLPEVSPAERERLLQTVREALDPHLHILKRNRGVIAVLAAGVNGQIFHALSEQQIDLKALAATLWQGYQEFGGLVYWVLEFESGLLIFQPVGPELFLGILGTLETNFGGLRYIMDRNQMKILESVSSIDLKALAQ